MYLILFLSYSKNSLYSFSHFYKDSFYFFPFFSFFTFVDSRLGSKLLEKLPIVHLPHAASIAVGCSIGISWGVALMVLRKRSEVVDFDLIFVVNLPSFLKVSIAIWVVNVRSVLFALIDYFLLDFDMPQLLFEEIIISFYLFDDLC